MKKFYIENTNGSVNLTSIIDTLYEIQRYVERLEDIIAYRDEQIQKLEDQVEEYKKIRYLEV